MSQKNTSVFSLKTHRVLRKAQINQVFVYIMAVVVFAAIFLFGYKAINQFLDEGEKASFIKFKTDLEKTVGRVAPKFDTVVVYNSLNPLRVPEKYERLCFVDVDVQPPADCLGRLGPVACDIWETAYIQAASDPDVFAAWEATEANVFLKPAGPLPIKVYKIRVSRSDGIECFDVHGQLDMRVEGRGSHVLISVP